MSIRCEVEDGIQGANPHIFIMTSINISGANRAPNPFVNFLIVEEFNLIVMAKIEV